MPSLPAMTLKPNHDQVDFVNTLLSQLPLHLERESSGSLLLLVTSAPQAWRISTALGRAASTPSSVCFHGGNIDNFVSYHV
jgi:hypothetical protein